MLKPLLFCCFLTSCCACFAQPANLDSLYLIYRQHKKDDTAKVSLLLCLASAAFDVDADKGLSINDSAIMLAQKIGSTVKLAEAYDRKVVLLYMIDSASAAFSLAQQSIVMFRQLEEEEGLALALFHLGLLHNSQSKYTTSIPYEEEALAIFEKLQNKKRIAAVLNSLGANYRSLGNNEEAIRYYLRSVKLFEELKDDSKTAMLFDNIAMVYESFNNNAEAMNYFNQSLAIYTQLNNKAGIAKVLNGLGTLYDNLHQTDKALAAYQQALTVNESLHNKAETGANCVNIGILFFGKKQYDSALQYFTTSYHVFTETGNQSNLAVAARYIGDIYNQAPDTLLKKQHFLPSQRIKISFGYYQQALQYATASEVAEEEMYTWQSMSHAYARNRQFAPALEAYKKYDALKDSLFTDEKKDAITHAGMQYEFDKKEAVAKAVHDKKQALVKAELSRQRVMNIAIAGGALVLLVAGFTSFLFYKRRRDAIEKSHEAELKADIAETEMKALRAQMNPHFIFNSLNSVSDYIVKNDNKTADEYVTKFARVMRLILENSERKEISLADDLQALELYMQLEALRLQHKFSYEIIVDENIDVSNTLIPPLLLQPFVENSIWHGIAQKNGTGKIWVRIKQENNRLVCIVEDNGIGLSAPDTMKKNGNKKEKSSMGMKITNARIDVINRTKKANASVKLFAKEEGVRTELQLPLELIF